MLDGIIHLSTPGEKARFCTIAPIRCDCGAECCCTCVAYFCCTGEIDLIAAQGSKDPLLADAKIFDGDKRGKACIRKVFNQIYTYTQQYNEPFGYLVIFKTTNRDLYFSLSTTSRNVPVVVYNHKTIFLLTIDIYPHSKPVSQRDPLKAIEITEEDLIDTIKDPGFETVQ